MTLLAAEDTSSTTSARGGLTAHQVLLLAVAVFTARLNVEREAFVVEDGGELEAAAESVSHEGVALADGRLTGEGGVVPPTMNNPSPPTRDWWHGRRRVRAPYGGGGRPRAGSS